MTTMQSLKLEIKEIAAELTRYDPTLKTIAYYARNEYEMECLKTDNIPKTIAELRRFPPYSKCDRRYMV